MAAAQIEVQSFIDKFSHLSSQGYIAYLNFSCNHGKISVSFQAELGFMHGAPEPLTPFLTQQLKPSQVRRFNRRYESRNANSNVITAKVENNVTVARSNADKEGCHDQG